jgi:hypothetical protein
MGTLSALPAAIGATFESILASPAARGLLLWKAAFAASALWYGALMARVYAQFEADASKFQDLRLQGPIAGALAVRRAAAPVALGLFPAALILRFSVAPTLGMLAGGAAAPVLGSTVWEAARTLLPFLASFLLQRVVLWRAASGSSLLAGRDVSRGLAALVTAVPFQVAPHPNGFQPPSRRVLDSSPGGAVGTPAPGRQLDPPARGLSLRRRGVVYCGRGRGGARLTCVPRLCAHGRSGGCTRFRWGCCAQRRRVSFR